MKILNKLALGGLALLAAASALADNKASAFENLRSCTHWHHPPGLDSFNPFFDKARVSGEKSELVPLRKPHPDVCAIPAMKGAPECKPTAYAQPSELMLIHFTCGDWAWVDYTSENACKTDWSSRGLRTCSYSGWIHLTRLEMLPLGRADRKAREGSRKELFPTESSAAIYSRDIKRAFRLLKNGADPDQALLDGVKTNQLAIVEESLLRLKANRAWPGVSCELMLDAARTSPGIINALVAAGGSVNCKNAQGATPLHAAVYLGTGRIEYWKNRGLPEITAAPVIENMLRLIFHGADIEASDGFGNTPLRRAVQELEFDAALALIRLGADPNARNSSPDHARQAGVTGLMGALSTYVLTKDPSVIVLLLSAGANPDVRSTEEYNPECDGVTPGSSGGCLWWGQTALTRAAMDGSFTVVKLLLEHGANPNIPRSDGKSPYEIAREFNHKNTASLIRAYGGK